MLVILLIRWKTIMFGIVISCKEQENVLGYEPADLTMHPPPRTAEGGFIFFV